MENELIETRCGVPPLKRLAPVTIGSGLPSKGLFAFARRPDWEILGANFSLSSVLATSSVVIWSQVADPIRVERRAAEGLLQFD